MPLAALIQLLPVLLNALAPLLDKLIGSTGTADAQEGASIVTDLQQAFSLAQQAGAVVALCQKEGRDPTPAEFAPFDAAWQTAQAQLQADIAAATGTGATANDSGPNPPDKPR